MNQVDIKYVVLYRTPRCWRVSVFEEPPGGIGCGELPGTSPDAAVEIAQRDLLEYLRREWNFTGELAWEQTKPDWWAAEVITNPKP
ncbi:hypothetical protein HC031_14025 [Planosporangium thailandense]|uniref:HicB-like antitoxin of toxin-antitoxin system domain-containing protein n=1 Tax=Planosporangium thailandense TaxID=765197 RepID=A0ABX0XZQ3_9ACTN|nr:hypothetical protein [Planosporangium thailandense]NJC70825.1 hypothetical protein [Planosporangium thailandense]